MAAGAGLAVGLGSTLRRHRVASRPKASREDRLLQLEPLLDRMDAIEFQANAARSATLKYDAKHTVATEAPEHLIRQIHEHEKRIETLQTRLDEAERRSAELSRSLNDQLANVRAEVPAALEAAFADRGEELGEQVRREMLASQADALAGFELALDERVSRRMAALDEILRQQSGSLAALAEKAASTDASLQKLIGAVERLVERITPAAELAAAPALLPDAPANPTEFLDLPFQAHLDREMKQDTPIKMFRTLEEIRENGGRQEDEPHKARFPLAQIMLAAIAGLFGAKFLR